MGPYQSKWLDAELGIFEVQLYDVPLSPLPPQDARRQAHLLPRVQVEGVDDKSQQEQVHTRQQAHLDGQPVWVAPVGAAGQKGHVQLMVKCSVLRCAVE